jgi:signal transduction histidine kinase
MDLQQQMLAIARYGAANIQTNEIEKITDITDEHFLELKKELRLIEQTYGLREGLAYIVEIKDKKPVFSVMTNVKSFRGEHYPEEAVQQIYETFKGKEVTSDLYEDQNGEFISVLVPLKDGGQVKAVLEIDFLGEDYKRELYSRLWPFLQGILLVLIVPFTAIFVILLKLYRSHEREMGAQQAVHAQNLAVLEAKEKFQLEVTNKQIEAERLRNEALDEQRRRFFAMVVHDLRTPVTTLFLLLDSMKKDLKPEANTFSHIEMAHKEFKLIKTLFDDVTMLNNIQFAGFTPRYEKIEIKSIIEETLNRLNGIAGQKGIAFKLSSKQVILDADEALLQRVLNNLLTNAIQHGTEKTDIQINGATMGEKLILKVTNKSNHKIAPDKINHIFEPFVRFADKKKEDMLLGSNSGLGLSISKAIVEAHSGKIFAHIEDENTLSFVIELPLKQPSQKNV